MRSLVVSTIHHILTGGWNQREWV